MPIDGYIDVPFCLSGTKTTVPDAVQPGGNVSYTEGYGPDYTLEPGSPGALNVQNYEMNQIFYDLSLAIQNWQQNTIAPFITSTMNGGTPYSYSQYNMVLLGGVGYISLVNSNTDTPPSSKWTTISLGNTQFFTGGATTGTANAQVLASVTPSGFSLSNNGATVACTIGAGLTNTGSMTVNIGGTGATIVKKDSGSGLVNCTGGEATAGDTVFFTVNTAASCLVINSAPALGNIAPLNTDGTNFQASGSNLAFGTAPVLPSATTATTQSGTDSSTHIATTAQVQAAIVAAFPKFTSTGNSISNASSLTLPHSLGTANLDIQTSIVCATAEFGYSIGDELLVSFGGPFNATGGGGSGAAITFDNTNVYVKFANTANILDNLLNKSTGATVQPLTAGNWTLTVRAKQW